MLTASSCHSTKAATFILNAANEVPFQKGSHYTGRENKNETNFRRSNPKINYWPGDRNQEDFVPKRWWPRKWRSNGNTKGERPEGFKISKFDKTRLATFGKQFFYSVLGLFSFTTFSLVLLPLVSLAPHASKVIIVSYIYSASFQYVKEIKTKDISDSENFSFSDQLARKRTQH